jgi:hypothetical protein
VLKKPAAASAASVADVDIVWEDAASLRAYDVEARQWFNDDPTMFKSGLQRKFLKEKGLHLKLSVAESYLKRLRMAAGQAAPIRMRKSRAKNASAPAAMGVSISVSKDALAAFEGLVLLPKGADFGDYMPSLKVAFAAEPSMTLPRLQLALAEQGVKTTRSAMTLLLDKLKTDFLASKVDVFRDYRCRMRAKQSKFACGIDHSSFHRLEPILRQQMALDPCIDAAGLLAFLGTLGYTVWCGALGKWLGNKTISTETNYSL